MLQLLFKLLCRSISISAVFLLGLISSASAAGTTFDLLTVDFMSSHLTLNPDTGLAKINTGGGEIEVPGNWEVRKIDERQFHLHRAGWHDFFWSVDIENHQVQKVAGGKFGSLGGEKTALKRIMADFATKDFKGQPIIPRLELTFLPASLVYNPKDKSLRFTAEGMDLIDGKSLEIKFINSGEQDLCQIRHRNWGKSFWEINIKEGKVSWAEGEYGRADGYRQPPLFMGRVTVLNPRNAAGTFENQGFAEHKEPSRPHSEWNPGNVYGTFEDLGFAEFKETRRPRSQWIESQKALYRDLLKKGSYDVLIIPFQVQGYAIDRVGRSLMTRYLADRIAESTTLRVPDPTLVARALGQDARTIDEDEIFRLANDLKVKLLIRGSAGHNRDEKLKLTLLVQNPDANGFASKTGLTRLDWQDISFSDEHQPEAAFKDILPDVMSKLPLKITHKPAQVRYKKGAVTIPANIQSMTTGKTASPIMAAWHLQFLGMLFPEDTTEMEHLFERSLIVLNQVSPDSPDYPILKARALFYLHRRPAALAELGTPRTPEEKGLAALLNGNLPSLKRAVSEMKAPLPKLMASIELNDLRWAYRERVKNDDYRKVVEGLPQWEILIARRLLSRDSWFTQTNLAVKQQMDELFPVTGFTVHDLVASKVALAEIEADDADIAMSVREHSRRYLEGNGETLWNEYGSQYLSKGDALDLFNGIGDANLLQGLKIRIFLQVLPEEALDEMRSYEKVYLGHPAMTFLKGAALTRQWQSDKKLKHLIEQRDELFYQAFYWSGGQIDFNYTPNFRYYEADYPQRPFWEVSNGNRTELKGDKLYDLLKSSWKERVPGESAHALNFLKKILMVLKYSDRDFKYIRSGYNWLGKQQAWKSQVNTFLEELKRDRFEGNPDRIQFEISVGGSSQDPGQRIKMLEEAIAAAPDLWESYYALGYLYLEKGEFKKTEDTFLRYPLFKDGEEDDRVRMSNIAYRSAVEIWRRGGIDESLSLFRIAADSNTGSGAEMVSGAILAVMAGDFGGGASQYLNYIKRYRQGYDEYLTLLHTGGLHQESWSVFNTIDIQSNSPEIWTPAFVGHRMEAFTGDKIGQWLSQDHFNGVDSDFLSSYLLASLLIDRPPDRNAPKLISDTMKKLKNTPEEYTSTFYRPNLAVFAEGFLLQRMDEFGKAYEMLDKWVSQRGRAKADFAVPYLAWCGIRSKNTAKINELLPALEKEYGDSGAAGSKAYYHMAKAYYSGLQGKHQEAMEDLKLARYCIPFTGNRPFQPWYQLVEACEWLFKETGFAAYRDLALEWAKIHQRIEPYFAWAYAVEAKYTASETDRTRALALTLYLDRNSERISGFSDKDRARALKWLEQNNPFLMDEDSASSRKRRDV